MVNICGYVTSAAPDASHRLPSGLQCGHHRSFRINLDYKSAYEKKNWFVQNFVGESLNNLAEEVRNEGYKIGIRFDSKYSKYHAKEGKMEGAHRMVMTIKSPSLPREQPLCAARI